MLFRSELQKTRIAVRGELDAAENKFNEVNKKWTDANAAVDKAAAAQQSIAKKIGLLDEAAQKLEQAKALGDDADIQASIAATRAKIEAIKPQLTAAEQATATATANRDTIAASKETERANWKSVVDRVVPVEQQLHAADAAMTQARGGYQTAHRHAASLQQRIDRLERLATWFERSQELRSLQNQTSQFAAQIAVMEQAMVAMNTEKAASEQAVTQVQGTIEEVSKQREPIASKRTVSQSQKEKLIATKNQLTESKGLVADVAPIDAAIVLIDSTVALRDGELANLDADLKKYDQQMAEMTTQLDNAKKALAAVGEKLQAHQGMVAMQKQQLEKSVESSNTIANDCSSLREKVSLDCESVFALPPERALSPEQFAWSLLTARS